MNMMICNKCNKQIPEDSRFCPFCGYRLATAAKSSVAEPIAISANATPDTMVKRALLLIEDGLFDRADQYLEVILDQDPENAQAYLGKLLIDLQVNTMELLAEQEVPFDRNGNFVKAVRYADDDLANTLVAYSKKVKQEAYDKAVCAVNAHDANKYMLRKAVELLEALGNYEDAESLKEHAIAKLNTLGTYEGYNEVYMEACKYSEANSIEGLTKALKLFESIPFYEDAQEKVTSIKEQISKLKKVAEEVRKGADLFFALFFAVGVLSITLAILLSGS